MGKILKANKPVKKRGRHALMTTLVAGTLKRLYKRHPKWTSEMFMNELRRMAEDGELSGITPDKLPGRSRVDKELAILRKSKSGLPLDDPWSVASLSVHEIPPSALPVVLMLSEVFRQKEQRLMTIREAVWGSRLSALVETASLDLPMLFSFVIQYAWQESFAEQTGSEELAPTTEYQGIDADLYHMWITLLPKTSRWNEIGGDTLSKEKNLQSTSLTQHQDKQREFENFRKQIDGSY